MVSAFFKSIKSLSSSKKQATRIVGADFKNDTAVECKKSNEETDNSTECVMSSSSSNGPNNLEQLHRSSADDACNEVLKLADEIDGWQVWETIDRLTIEKKVSQDSIPYPFGRGTIFWQPEQDYTFQAVEDFIWDNQTKNLYDEFSDKVIILVDYDPNYQIVDQIFHGRFGISGRNFVIVIKKQRFDTETHDRMVIGCKSIPDEDIELCERQMKDDELAAYKEAIKRKVRGHVYIAGYLLERDRRTNEFRMTYVNRADVKSTGVPQWIVNRVKLDQLKILKNVPKCLEDRAANPAPS